MDKKPIDNNVRQKGIFLILYNKKFVELFSQKKDRLNIFTHLLSSSSFVFLRKYNWKSYFLNQSHHHFPVFLSNYFLFHRFDKKFSHPHNIVYGYEYKHRNQNHILASIYFKQKEYSNWGQWNKQKRDKTYLKKKNRRITGINPSLSVILLNERNQLQKTKFYIMAFIFNVQNRHIFRGRKQIGGCRGLREGDEEWRLKGTGFLLGVINCP